LFSTIRRKKWNAFW